jgi:Tfp pilus assembly PilM family ATPase
MINLSVQRTLTGLEIGETDVKIAQVAREKRGWRLLSCGHVPLPQDTLKLSYKTENINDPQAFIETVENALGHLSVRVSRVGLSLPNEVVRVTIQRYTELPKSRSEREKMITWWSKKSVPFPIDRARIAHQQMGKNDRGENILVVAIAFEDVIKEYELNLRELKIHPEVIRPRGINHYDFYCDRIPPSGTNAFLGLFERFFTYFVFEEGQLVFYRGFKRGFSDPHFFQDIEMTMQLYLGDGSDKEIEKLFYATQVGFLQELDEGLKSITASEVIPMEEGKVRLSYEDVNEKGERLDLSPYASALGAALSLAK